MRGWTAIDSISLNGISMRYILATSFLMLQFGCIQSRKPETTEIQTPEAKVIAEKLSSGPEGPQRISPVVKSEIERFRSLAAQGPAFVTTYFPDVTHPDLKDYDRAFRAWQISPEKQYTDQQVIEILGAYLGNLCVAELDMEWVTVTDKYGTDFAVRSKQVESMGFPFSSVMKRVEDHEFDFMHGVFHTIKKNIESGEAKRRE